MLKVISEAKKNKIKKKKKKTYKSFVIWLLQAYGKNERKIFSGKKKGGHMAPEE